MWKNAVEQCRPQKTIWHMRIACWITKATHTHTHTHSKYVILITFPLQQWLQERASMLHYTYIACIAIFYVLSFLSYFTVSLSHLYYSFIMIIPKEFCNIITH